MRKILLTWYLTLNLEFSVPFSDTQDSKEEYRYFIHTRAYNLVSFVPSFVHSLCLRALAACNCPRAGGEAGAGAACEMSGADPRVRSLKIKTGVVRRVGKEALVYTREAEAQRARVERLRAAGEEEHALRKQEEVLQEALMMVPDCRRRLVKAHADLKGLLESELDLKEQEDYKAAQKVIEDAEKQLAETSED